MKKLIAAALIATSIGIFTGCTNVTATGPGWTLNEQSFLWSRKNITATVSTNGATSLHEDESTPDQQSIAVLSQAIIQMAAQGGKTAAVP